MQLDKSKPLYLSGPMTGIPYHNFPLFNKTAVHLRELGFIVENPAEYEGGKTDGTWAYFLRRDLKAMLKCGAIAVLPGWRGSRGAWLEVYVARRLGMPVIDAITLLPWGVPPADWTGPVIGLWGAATVGKDTIQRRLNWSRAAFADALKEDLTPLFVQMGLHMGNPDDKARARDLLVEYGRLGRTLDPDYWIKRLFLPPGPVCITDVRYINEMKWIWSKGGMVFEIVRPGIEPANAEERRSFQEIRDYCQANRITIPVICNDVEGHPEYAADDIRSHLLPRYGSRAA